MNYYDANSCTNNVSKMLHHCSISLLVDFLFKRFVILLLINGKDIIKLKSLPLKCFDN